MRFIIKTVLGLLLLAALFFGFAMGSGETISLRTFSRNGMGHETSLWIVEDRGRLWIRAGQPDSKWLVRLEANPRVSLTRNGQTRDYKAVLSPKQRERVNRLMAEKYGWVDSMLGSILDRSVSTPIRLDRIRD